MLEVRAGHFTFLGERNQAWRQTQHYPSVFAQLGCHVDSSAGVGAELLRALRFTLSSLGLTDLFLSLTNTNNREGASAGHWITSRLGWGHDPSQEKSFLNFPWRPIILVRKSFFRSNWSPAESIIPFGSVAQAQRGWLLGTPLCRHKCSAHAAS